MDTWHRASMPPASPVTVYWFTPPACIWASCSGVRFQVTGTAFRLLSDRMAFTVSGRMSGAFRSQMIVTSSISSGWMAAAFPSRIRLNTFRDSSGWPWGSKNAWLSTALPP